MAIEINFVTELLFPIFDTQTKYMICFPNCKINIGLYVTEKRPDRYHNIETIVLS